MTDYNEEYDKAISKLYRNRFTIKRLQNKNKEIQKDIKFLKSMKEK